MANAFTEILRLHPDTNAKRCGDCPDPIVAHARAWMAGRDLQDSLIRTWQETEHRLSVKVKPLAISLAQAVRGDLPEARSMRSLMRRIKMSERKLDRAAAQIALMQSTSPLGALAKIEMALRMQQPANSEERTWALVESGVGQLRELLLADPR